MKKRFLTIILTLTAMLMCIFGFSACKKGGHTHTYTKTIIEATCTEQGYTEYICSCGHKYTNEYIGALGHSFLEYNFNNDATCIHNGTETATCSRVGCIGTDTQERENSAFGHHYEKTNYVWNENNCTATRICERDRTHIETETVIATYAKDTDATCTAPETGHYVAVFNNDGFETQTTINNSVINGFNLKHVYSTLKYSEIEHWYECVCGDKKDIENHIPSASATETTDQICTVCERVLVPAFGHKHTLHLTKVDAKEQSCIQTGNIEYYICTCDKWFANSTATIEIRDKTSVIIEKTEHQHNSLQTSATQHWYECVCGDKDGIEEHYGKAVTCTEEAVCEECKVVYAEANGHNYKEMITAPTCTEQGFTLYTCSCGDNYVGAYKSALEHDFTNYISDNNATCIEDGTETAVCSRQGCDETNTRTDDNSTIEHTYKEQVAELGYLKDEATCTSKAIYYKSCKCGKKGTETFEYGVFSHPAEDVWSFDNVYHWKNFTCDCVTKVDYVTHNIDVDGVCTICDYMHPTQGVIYRFSLDKTYAYVSGYIGTAKKVKIESFYENVPVTAIGGSAFRGCDTVTSIIIPDGVNRISISAFYGCSSLTSVKLPDSITAIGNYAFYGCSGLTSVNIPNGVTTIGDYVFYGCSSLTSVQLPEGVVFIGDSAFYGCDSLMSITIPDSVTSIGEEAFKKCASLIDVHITSIEAWCYITFKETYSNPLFGTGNLYVNGELLTTLTIPNNIREIGSYAFSGCDSLTSVTIPDSVYSIGFETFYDCDSLTSILIPNSVVAIGEDAVQGCSALTIYCEVAGWQSEWYWNWNPAGYPVVWDCKNNDVANDGYVYTVIDGIRYGIKDGEAMVAMQANSIKVANIPSNITYNNKIYPVTSIGDDAFSGCSSLTAITIPNSITSIGEWAFRDRRDLIISCEAASMPSGWKSTWNRFAYGAYCFVVWDCKNNDVANDGYVYTVIDGIRYGIKDGEAIVAKQSNSITTINVPSSIIYNNEIYPVTTIGGSAFSGCSSLTSIIIPDSVTTIGSSAFSDCSSLTSIIIPDGVTSIGNSVFYNCSSLTSISIPDSVTSIGNSVFCNCRSLTSITIPNSVATIGDDAFYGCSSLTSIIISDSVISIGGSAFSGCSSLTSISIPDSVTSIGDYAFRNCSSLTSISIPDSITDIGKIFQGCGGLTSLTIPDSMTSIESYAFSGCSSLTSIIIPDSVTTIGSSAFSDCSSLTSIIIPDGVTSIGNSVFYGCSSLTSIIIPDGVTSIESYAFSGCSSLTSITIPNSVTTIGSSAFSGCSSLTSIIIPDSVTSIGDYVFYNCSSLTSITIPDSVTSIGDYVFSGCSSLTSVVIGANVTTIGIYAFEDCDSLTNITIPDSITAIGDYVFYNCSSLTNIRIPEGITDIGKIFQGCSGLTSIIIPDSVTTIKSYAFNGCINLTSVTIGNGVTTIGDYAFYNLDNLTSVVIGDSVTSIGDYVFYNCSSLTSISIPDSVTTIGSYAFRGCSSLTSIIIPDSVTSIGGSAFSGCSGLTSIIIPDSVTTIGDHAFGGCDNLIIYCESTSQPSGWKSNWNKSNRPIVWDCKNNNTADDGDIYMVIDGIRYGIKDGEVMVAMQSNSITTINVPSSIIYNNEIYPVTSIGDDAFADCSSLTSIIIPDSVTTIGSYAFYNCSSLTSIIIPDSVTTIGSYAFRGCSSLTSIIIPDSVTTIGSYAFRGCSSLTSIIIPDSVTTIGSYAFYNCRSLTSITIPDSVSTIGNGAFQDCHSLTSFRIPDGITSIGAYTFDYCYSLTSITIPNSVTTIGDDAFYGCSSLTSVVITDVAAWYNISGLYNLMHWGSSTKNLYLNNELVTELVVPDGVTLIDDYAFSNCSSLTSITIPDSVKTIESYAFNNCINLVSVTIGNGVTMIGDYAFYNLDNLTSVVIGDGVTTIGERAFCGCEGLTAVTIPKSVTSIGKWAFYGRKNLIIYCESASQPSSWESNWNPNDHPIVWDCKNNNTADDGDVYTVIDGIRYVIKYVEAMVAMQSNSITTINVPSSITYNNKIYPVTTIDSYAFSGCSSLTSVVIGANVTTIGFSAFSGCSSLTSIIIPDSVTSIGDSAFAGCEKLSLITVDENNELYSSIEGNLYTKDGGELIQYASGKMEDFFVIPDGVISIGGSAFSDCSRLMSIKIPDSVTSIGNSAFYNCSGLTSIIIPDSVTTIGASAFSGCSRLMSIKIPDSVTTISNSIFNDCDNLVVYCEAASQPAVWNINWASGRTSFIVWDCNHNDTAMNGYAYAVIDDIRYILKGIEAEVSLISKEIATLTIPSMILFKNQTYSVTSIGKSAFYDCSSLTSIIIPDSVTTIGGYVFSGCSSLTSITIPDSVTSIDDFAFCRCSSLTSVVIGANVTTIGIYAFEDCDSLTNIVIPDSVTSIGNGAFSGCSSLTSVVIGDIVESIGAYTFHYCSSLTSITFKDASTWYRTDDSTNWNNKTGGTQTSVTSWSTNATYFTTYYNYYWYKV